MKLSEYLKQNNLTHENFSDMVGVKRPFITNIINRKKNPSIQVARRIEDATNGKVALKDLVELEPPYRAEKKIKDE